MELYVPDSNESSEGLKSSPDESIQPTPPLPLSYMHPNLDLQTAPAQYHQGLPASTLPRNRLTVPAACIACRTKHLKCDGANPCSRCNSYGIECSYVRSRRGYKGPRRINKQATAALPETGGGYVSCPINSIEYPGQSLGSNSLVEMSESQLATTGANGAHNGFSDTQGGNSVALAAFGVDIVQAPLDTAQYSPAVLRERCIEAFFRYFHPAHPFLLPKSFLLARLKVKPLPHLEAAIRYIGSFYVTSALVCSMEEEARLAISTNPVRDGFAVQTMLLLCIGLDGRNEQRAALDFLLQAQDLALELGMHQREFGALHGENLKVLEESWRRTWWELYVVDGMIAGVHQQSSFRLNTVPANVLLPCEEAEYNSGRIPVSHSMEEFDDESFCADDVEFSSFTYRIAAIQNLGKILVLQEIVFGDDPIIGKTDAYLVNWGLHLPSSKKLAIDGEGQVDEMLFQAQMITNASFIMLHRPHSQLDTSVVRNINSCAPFRHVLAGQSYNVHAAKIIQAAENISKLITLPTPLAKHTHFFTCVITLASIVHLSCWAALLPLSQDDNLKQQIRLNTGALKTISEVWPSAERVGYQVKGVAQEVFASRKAAADEGFWSSFTNEELMRSIIEDEEIIDGFQLK